jgi:hypothetical protein
VIDIHFTGLYPLIPIGSRSDGDAGMVEFFEQSSDWAAQSLLARFRRGPTTESAENGMGWLDAARATFAWQRFSIGKFNNEFKVRFEQNLPLVR